MTMTHDVRGFTLVEIMIVVAIIGLLAIMAMPAFFRAALATRTSACINNLRQIEMAKDQWALENHKAIGAACAADDIDVYLKRKFEGIKEPAGGSYTINNVGTDATCSSFAVDTHPATL
jgi:prepilin-type N-terminal cleavage/methylation domain-containing protein